MMTHEESIRIAELLIRCCDGTALGEEMAELEVLIGGGPEVAAYCVGMLMTLGSLQATSLAMSRRFITAMNRITGKEAASFDAPKDETGDRQPQKIIPWDPDAVKKRRRPTENAEKDLEE